MSKKISNGAKKTCFKAFTAWDYEFLEQYLNDMSAKGWHAYSVGSFIHKFEYNDSIQYVYRFDYQREVPDERYRETFKDNGWEIMSYSINWVTLRKKCNPECTDSDYEIYTDVQSRNDMLKRWRKVLGIVFLSLLLTNLNTFNLLKSGKLNFLCTTALLAVYAFIFIIFAFGIISSNRIINGKKNKKPFPLTVFLIGIVAALALFLLSMFI